MGKPKKSWWGRNWIWFVPTVCLAMLLMLAALGSVIYLGYMELTKAMRTSGAYVQAVAVAERDSRVIAALGLPMNESRLLTGSISINHDWSSSGSSFGKSSGQADMVIRIYGPKGSATIYAVASMSAGKWSFSKLVARTADGKEIDLNQKSKPGNGTEARFWQMAKKTTLVAEFFDAG